MDNTDAQETGEAVLAAVTIVCAIGLVYYAAVQTKLLHRLQTSAYQRGYRKAQADGFKVVGKTTADNGQRRITAEILSPVG